MAERHFLAFDLGAESGRAVVGSLRAAAGSNSATLTLAEKHRFPNPNGRMNGHLQWNLLGQWEELKTGLRKAGAGNGAEGALKLSGIGVDAWGVDFGLLTPTGEILGNPFHYRDSRTDGILEKIFAKVPREKVFQSTGIQIMAINSLFQLAAMREANSDLLRAAGTLLFVPDLFNYLFTGTRKSEFSIASTSQMVDMSTGKWAEDLLRQLDLPTRLLPPLVPSGTVIGPLLPDVAAECSVGPIPVIAPATHDTASAVAAVPAQGEDWCYISSGTWSLMGVELPHPIINEKTLRYNYTNEGGVGGTVRLLKNIMGLWLVQECRRQWLRDGHEYSYSELTRLAGEAKPFNAVVDPNHVPFLSPGQMPAKIEQFCRDTKQPTPASAGECVRTCLEGLAFTYRRTIEGLEDILGKKIAVIHIVGGGTQNELLNQMTADACARPVIAGPVEATAIGNILVQAMATGDVKSLSDARAIVRGSFDVKRYDPRNPSAWNAPWQRYREVSERP